MSCIVNGTNIKLTRGDTMRLKVGILQDGEPYTPETGDQVRFAMRENVLTTSTYKEWKDAYVLTKNIPTDTLILELEPDDTKDLGFGTYVYDIEITFADGTVDTFITKAQLKLTEEVE